MTLTANANFSRFVTEDSSVRLNYPVDNSQFTDTDLINACRRGDVQAVESYLNGYATRRKSLFQQLLEFLGMGKKTPQDVTDEYSNKLVHIASQYGHDDLLEILVRRGSCIDARNRHTGATPLHLAAIHGHCSTAEWLVEKGADINAVDNLHRTPLQWAASENRLDMVQTLIHRGADVNFVSKGKTAFDFATDPRIKAYLFKRMDDPHRLSISPFDIIHRPSVTRLEHHNTVPFVSKTMMDDPKGSKFVFSDD